MSDAALEVVRTSPARALDRALRREKKKQRMYRNRVQQDEQDMETLGQELEWVEEDMENTSPTSNHQSQPSNETKKMTSSTTGNLSTPKRSLFGRRGAAKSPKESTRQMTNKANNTAGYHVKFVPPSTPGSVPLRHQVAAKRAQNARELLDKALSSPQAGQEMLQSAFAEAAEARLLVDPTPEAEMELQLSMSLGEEEVLRAHKSFDQQHNNIGDAPDEDTDVDDEREADHKSSFSDHAENARQYLESMLPKFLDDAISDDDDEDYTDTDGEEGTDGEQYTDNEQYTDGDYTDEEENQCTDGDDDDEEVDRDNDEDDGVEDDVDDIDEQYRAEMKLRREAQSDKITQEVVQSDVQQKNSISTLGFDNTFQENETLTITSLNEVLDAPLSQTDDDDAKKARKVSRPRASSGVSSLSKSAKSNEPKKPRKWFVLSFGRKQRRTTKETKKLSTSELPPTAIATTVQPNTLPQSCPAAIGQKYVSRFTPTVNPPEQHDNDNKGPCKDQVKNTTKATAQQLREAKFKPGSGAVSSWNDVPHHIARGGPTAPQPRDHSKIHTEFVAAPKVQPGILSQASWDSLADGVPLDEICSPGKMAIEKVDQVLERTTPETKPPRSKRRGIFGIFCRKSKKDDGTPDHNKTTPEKLCMNEMRPTETTSEDPEDPDPNKLLTISALSQDSFPTEGDKYATVAEESKGKGKLNFMGSKRRIVEESNAIASPQQEASEATNELVLASDTSVERVLTPRQREQKSFSSEQTFADKIESNKLDLVLVTEQDNVERVLTPRA